MQTSTQKWLGFFLALSVILFGLGYLVFGKLEKNIVYFVTPSELLEKGESAIDQPIRLGGSVKKGSIVWGNHGTPSLHFLLTDGAKDVPVVSDQTPPQMFREEMGIVVEGKWAKSGTFESDRLMVKHSNEYHPPKEGEKPEIIYKDLVQ